MGAREYPAGSRARCFRQACREVLGERFPQLQPGNLFVRPDYSGPSVSSQDCWRDRAHLEIRRAVRSVLRKMDV